MLARICWILLLAAAPASAEPAFAIRCIGKSINWLPSPESGRMKVGGRDDIDYLYVVDPAAKTFRRWLEPRQEMDSLCATGQACSVDVSQGLIRYEAIGGGTMRSEFRVEIDRKSGYGTASLIVEGRNGLLIQMEDIFICERAEMPHGQPARL